MIPSLRPTTIAPYTLGAVRWQCTPENTYLWRSDCGRYFVWREGPEWFAGRLRRDEIVAGGKVHKDILSAMASAQTEPKSDQGRAVA